MSEIIIKPEARNKKLQNQLPRYGPLRSKADYDIRSLDGQPEENTFKVYSNSTQKIVKRKR